MEMIASPEVFAAMPWAMLLIIVAAAFYALTRGADSLVEGASGLAYRLGIPKVVVGATIVSLGTTSPEAAVSVLAAWQGNPELALGNAVGSIIADTALIFGLACLLVRLPADRFILSRQGWVQFMSGLGLAVLCVVLYLMYGNEASIGRAFGLVLLGLLVLYMIISVHWSKQHPEGVSLGHGDSAANGADVGGKPRVEPHHPAGESLPAGSGALVQVLMLVIGLAVVILSSKFLIGGVTEIAHRMNVPNVVISATLVAFGTSLPELATAIASIMKGHRELLVGNVIGADILNVLFVVGASATAADLRLVEPLADGSFSTILLYLHLPVMIAVLALFRVYIAMALGGSGSFSRWMGAPLVAAYVAYVVLQLVLTAGTGVAH